MIHVKLLLETPPERAQSSAKPLVDVARSLTPAMNVRSGPYWKIESLSEVILEMSKAADAEEAFSHLMRTVGIGWKLGGTGPEKSGVWEGQGTALMPALRWVNIELFPAQS